MNVLYFLAICIFTMYDINNLLNASCSHSHQHQSEVGSLCSHNSQNIKRLSQNHRVWTQLMSKYNSGVKGAYYKRHKKNDEGQAEYYGIPWADIASPSFSPSQLKSTTALTADETKISERRCLNRLRLWRQKLIIFWERITTGCRAWPSAFDSKRRILGLASDELGEDEGEKSFEEYVQFLQKKYALPSVFVKSVVL